jgi:predicted translin family RNA/ssDNA-binding protein
MSTKRLRSDNRDPTEHPPCLEHENAGEAASAVVQPIIELFAGLSKALDARLERRERFVRASRDLTMAAKKAIFELQRMKSSSKRWKETDTAWAKTEETFVRLRDLVQGGIVAELESQPFPTDAYWQYHAVFSPGVQEYVESLTLYHWLRYGGVLSFENLGQLVAPFPLALSDYVLGLCDTSGEVMRIAVQSSALGDQGISFEAHAFLCNLVGACSNISVYARRAWSSPLHQELERKLVTMGESLQKVQDVCYRICLRRAERSSLGFIDRDELDIAPEPLPD